MHFIDSNTQKRYFRKTISGDKNKYYFSLDGTLFVDGTAQMEEFNYFVEKDEILNEKDEIKKTPDYVNFIQKAPYQRVELTKQDLGKMICKP